MIRIDDKTVEEKFLRINGNKIRYLESGDSKKIIVLIHGLGASAERWDQVIPLFADEYRVIVPDLIGFGYSDKPLVDYTTEFFSEFLENFFIAFDKIWIHGLTHLLGYRHKSNRDFYVMHKLENKILKSIE